MTSLHLVVPGQVIASTASSGGNEGGSTGEDSFLRGHGTYLEHNVPNPSTGQLEQRLVASVCGIVQRVNQLITVVPCASSQYVGNVGDLVVGKVSSVGTNRWRVRLTQHGREAQLPLAGVHLPGGVQRIRTAQDQREMRHFLREGDWVSAEVHKTHPDGTILLHTRSSRYGKLEYGTAITVPPALIPRRKNHYMTDFLDTLDVVWGTNGIVWIQRKLSSLPAAKVADSDIRDEQRHEQLRKEHAEAPLLKEDRLAIARLRNAIESLQLVHATIDPIHVEAIYRQSLVDNIRPAEMLHPDNVLHLTAITRK